MPHHENELLPLTQNERAEMFEVFAGLKESDALRKIAPPPFGPGFSTNAGVVKVIERLREPETQWQERAIAAWTLGRLSLTLEEKQKAASALRPLIGTRTSERGMNLICRLLRGVQRTILVAGGAAMLVTLIAWLLLVSVDGAATLNVSVLLDKSLQLFYQASVLAVGVCLASLPIALPLSILMDSTRTNFVRMTAVTALGRLGLPETVGTLAEACRDNHRRVRAAAEQSLFAVLPLLTVEHYGRLPVETVPRLLDVLSDLWVFTRTHPNREERMVGLMDALGKIGDGRAIEMVRGLTEVTDLRRVRGKAQEILPILIARREQENSRGMLLRAASAPVSSPVELLRPVTSMTETAPEQLLRPIE